MFWGGGIGAAAIHLYTTYVAYQTSGVLAALLTFGMPPLSELYWLVSIWYATGALFNLYTLRILALGFLYLTGGVLIGVGVKLENSAKNGTNCRFPSCNDVRASHAWATANQHYNPDTST